eukprot:SAG22_NODE_48_length_24654_cov_4.406394_21_plen_547_part_00
MAGGSDRDQVAAWSRMLQAGTLTEAGYLAKFTTWAAAKTKKAALAESAEVLPLAAAAAGVPSPTDFKAAGVSGGQRADGQEPGDTGSEGDEEQGGTEEPEGPGGNSWSGGSEEEDEKQPRAGKKRKAAGMSVVRKSGHRGITDTEAALHLARLLNAGPSPEQPRQHQQPKISGGDGSEDEEEEEEQQQQQQEQQEEEQEQEAQEEEEEQEQQQQRPPRKKRKAARAPRPADMVQGKTSRHRGVSWSKAAGKWKAQIRQDGKARHLGRFADEDAAAEAYAAACREIGRDPTGSTPTPPVTGTSRFRGVSWCKRMGRWKAVGKFGGKTQQQLGNFVDDEAAARAYDTAARAAGFVGRCNFQGAGQSRGGAAAAAAVPSAQKKRKPEVAAKRETASGPAGRAIPAAAAQQPGKSSRHRGVSWAKADSKWRATIKQDGKSRTLGYFADESEAAAAYAAACRELGRDPAGPTATSRFRGVSWHKSKGRWEAKIRISGGKLKHLGRFKDEEEAARAYDAAARGAGDAGRCNFQPEGQRSKNSSNLGKSSGQI